MAAKFLVLPRAPPLGELAPQVTERARQLKIECNSIQDKQEGSTLGKRKKVRR